MAVVQTYQQLAQIYDATMATGVNTVIQNAVANNTANFADALTIYIMIIASLMCFREMAYRTFIMHALRASLIAMLLTVEGFNTYIATPAMDTVPTWIAQTANNANAIVAGPQQFDLLWSAVDHQKAAIDEQATGLSNIAYRAEVTLYAGIIQSFLTIAFWVYEFSRLLMGVIVAVVPFILFMFLFDATRQVPIAAARHIIGLFILQLMLSIMIQVMLAGDSTFMMTINGNPAAAAGLDEQLDILSSIAVFFGFGVGMVVVLPLVASHIGGGVSVNVGAAIMSRIPGTVGLVRGVAGRAGRAGSRAIARARSR
jgi:hypothetical protein